VRRQLQRRPEDLRTIPGCAYASGNIAMMYHLKKETPKTKPVVFRQPTTLYLTANKRPSVILKNSDDTRPVPAVVKPS
jgi:hypothetical protein